jgi:hypothetical protein
MSNRLNKFVPLALLAGAGIWAARRPQVIRDGLHDVADRLGDVVDTAADTLEPFARQVKREVIPEVSRNLIGVASRARHVAEPLLETAGELASDWVERGSHALHDATEWGEDAAHEVGSRAARASRGLGAKAGLGLAALNAWRHESEGKGTKMQSKLEKQLAARMARHEHAIHDLTKGLGQVSSRLKHLERPSRGGFSFGTLLLGAGAYYLYKNPGVLRGALEAISAFVPDAKGHLEAAGDAVKDGAERIRRGDDPVDAAKDAAKTAGSEVGKAAKAAKSEAESAAKDVARDVSNAAKDVAKDAPKMSA